MGMKYPKEVPMLLPEHIARGTMVCSAAPLTCGCLAGWCAGTIAAAAERPLRAGNVPMSKWRAYSSLLDELAAVCGGTSIESFNDNRENSRAKVAAKWNAFWRAKGYDIPKRYCSEKTIPSEADDA